MIMPQALHFENKSSSLYLLRSQQLLVSIHSPLGIFAIRRFLETNSMTTGRKRVVNHQSAPFPKPIFVDGFKPNAPDFRLIQIQLILQPWTATQAISECRD